VTSGSDKLVWNVESFADTPYYFDPTAFKRKQPMQVGFVSSARSAIWDRPMQSSNLTKFINGDFKGAEKTRINGKNEIGAALIVTFDSYAVDITKNNKIVAQVRWSARFWEITEPKGVDLFQFENEQFGVNYGLGGAGDGDRRSPIDQQNKALRDRGYKAQLTP
jgi:hypothetical protein